MIGPLDCQIGFLSKFAAVCSAISLTVPGAHVPIPNVALASANGSFREL